MISKEGWGGKTVVDKGGDFRACKTINCKEGWGGKTVVDKGGDFRACKTINCKEGWGGKALEDRVKESVLHIPVLCNYGQCTCAGGTTTPSGRSVWVGGACATATPTSVPPPPWTPTYSSASVSATPQVCPSISPTLLSVYLLNDKGK